MSSQLIDKYPNLNPYNVYDNKQRSSIAMDNKVIYKTNSSFECKIFFEKKKKIIIFPPGGAP